MGAMLGVHPPMNYLLLNYNLVRIIFNEQQLSTALYIISLI